MNSSTFLRRSLLVTCAIALAAGVVVYFLNTWFNETLLHTLGLSHSTGNAVGAVLLVFASYLGVHLVSLAMFRDHSYGEAIRVEAIARQDERHEKVLHEVARELHSVPAFIEVLRQQLSSTVEQTEQAANDIGNRLQTIDTVVDRLNSFVATRSQESAALVHTSEVRISNNQQLIAQMQEYIASRIHAAQDDQVRVKQVVQEARSLESLTQLIKDIAEQTNLLALNAAIEAARAGEAGRGFAVVADEVRKLSSETEKAVLSINRGIRGVATTIETQLEEKLASSNLSEESKALSQFADQLVELGKSYEEILHAQSNAMETVRQSSEELASMFLNALASVQFQDVTRQQIEHTSNAMLRLDQHLGALAMRLEQSDNPDFTYTPLSEHLDEIYANYVMEQQRHTHDDAVGRSPSSAGGGGSKIELF